MSLPSFLENLNPDIYLSDNYVVVDFEVDTSHGDFGHAVHPANQLLLASWRLGPMHQFVLAGGDESTRAHWGNELDHHWLFEAIAEADFVVAHSAKYELGWFKRMGIDIRNVLVFDTKLAEYVILGNLAAGSEDLGMPRLSTSLDMCCRRRGLPIKDPVVDQMISDGINPIRIPRPWLEGRCRQDVETTEAVFLDQRQDLRRRGLLPVLYTRCLLTPVLADIESEGMAVDPAIVRSEYDKFVAKRRELQAEWDKVTGGVNIHSPPQMAKLLYDVLGFEELKDKRGTAKRNAPTKQFPLGLPKTDGKTLDKLAAKTAAQKSFIKLRKELGKVEAMLSKNLEFFRGVSEEFGGVFHGEIIQTNTATQRTASRGMPMTFQNQLDDSGKPVTRSVQFQNFPRILKKILRAKRPGWLMADADGAQIEFRCAAFLGNDEQAIADIIDPTFDAHLLTASKLHNCSIEEVRAEKKAAEAAGRDDWRQLAKPDTYKPLYGGKFGTPEQERYYAYFQERYAGIARVQAEWVRQAVETKRQVTPWGLTYYWPTARRGHGGRVNAETAIDNYPIQALATAEIVPIAIVYLWHRIREAGLEEQIKIVNTVHDSVPCEIHPAAQEAFKRLAKTTFTKDVYRYIATIYNIQMDRVPLGVGIKIGEHWGQGSEEAFDIFRDGREVKRK